MADKNLETPSDQDSAPKAPTHPLKTHSIKSIFKNRSLRVWLPLIILALALPATVFVAMQRQNSKNFASDQNFNEELLNFVAVSPGSIDTLVTTKSVPLSALAYDVANNPIFYDGIDYIWSMSSTNSIGTLTKTNGKITEFIPLKPGFGDLTVQAIVGQKTVQKSMEVLVRNSDGTLPPGGPGLYLTDQKLIITNYATSFKIKAGERAKAMTITSNGATSFSFVDNPTTYGSGISWFPQTSSLANGQSVDVYIQVNSNVPNGQYSGTPEIISSASQVPYMSLASMFITVGDVSPTETPTPTFTPTLTPTPTFTPTPTPVPQPKTTSFIDVADTYVRSDQPNSNFGKDIRLYAKGTPRYIAYLKFDLSALKGKKILKAILRIKVSDLADAPSGAIENVEIVPSILWDENKLTYNTRPTLWGVMNTFKGDKRATYFDIDVTNPSLISVFNSSGKFSIGIDNSTANGIIINSKEATTGKPTLIITYQ